MRKNKLRNGSSENSKTKLIIKLTSKCYCVINPILDVKIKRLELDFLLSTLRCLRQINLLIIKNSSVLLN